MNNNFKYAPSLMCIDYFNIDTQIKILEKHSDYFHIDIMDGNFVPNIALNFDFLMQIKKYSKTPMDVHMMVTDPYDYLENIIKLEPRVVSVHLSTVRDSVVRLSRMLKSHGIKMGIALSPSESFDSVKSILPYISKITIMTVEPGYAGQSVIPEMVDKIIEVSNFKKENNATFQIEVDGSTNYEMMTKYRDAGNEVFILGSTLFNADNVEEEYISIKSTIEQREYCVLGIDLGGTFTRFGAVTTEFKVYDFEKVFSEDVMGNLSEWCKKYIANYNVTSVVIGIPGTVDPEGTIVKIPNLKGEFTDELRNLQSLLDIPVYFERDVNLLFEWDSKALNLENVIALYLGTGLGNVICLNGKIHYGLNHNAGEIGHLKFYEENLPCRCGEINCLESKVSGMNLEHILESSELNIPINKIFSKYSESVDLQEFIDNFARVVSIEMGILDIPNLILGGGVVEMEHFPKAEFEKLLNEKYLSEYSAESTKVYYADQLIEKGVLGAAKYGFRK